MSKENNHIDDLFKDAFDNWENEPQKDFWSDIAEDLDANDVDHLFKTALEEEEIMPSEKVWEGVKEHLPLNLWLKRRLAQLSYVAGILVVGMLATLYFTQEGTIEAPVADTPKYNIEIAIEEVPLEEIDLEENIALEEKAANDSKTLATDNTIDKKMKSVELNKEDEMVFDIDEEKIKAILQPIEPLPIDSSIARVNGNSNETDHENSSEEAILPKNLEDILPDNLEEDFEEN